MRTLLKLIGIVCFTMLLFISCDTALNDSSGDSGNVVINPEQGGDFLAKTLVPAIKMDVIDWKITGAGPGGRTYGPTVFSINASPITIVDLYKGTWDFTVEGRNLDAQIIGKGTKSVSIYSSQTTSASITVVPLAGNGTLNLSATWPASSLGDGTFVATLTGKDGTPHVLEGTINYTNGTASYSGQWAAGYYDLVVQLFDGEDLVWGTYEAVRIVEAQTTSGSIELTVDELNLAKNGTLSLTITNDMQNPFQVALSGLNPSLTAGSSMTVTANVDPSGTYAYSWYLNGAMIANENQSTITLGSSLLLGNYNLAVRVSDSKVISSASGPFHVVTPSNVIVDPDYNFTPDTSDTTPLQIVSINPANQATNVPVTSSISIYFNDLIDPISVDDVAMTVKIGAQTVDGKYSLVRTSNELFAVLHFTPNEVLPTGAVVTVTLISENGLVDKGGNTLGSQYISTFTTTSATLTSTANLGFEEPDLLSGWDINGNGGIVTLPFASALSLSGSKAVMITTGSATAYDLSGTPVDARASSLSSGTITVPGGATNLLFDYYWISDEFTEWIGSSFDDTLTMTIAGPNGTIVKTIESVNQYTAPDCTAISLNFGVQDGQGTFWHTGAKTHTEAISSLGSPLTINFTVSDVGDVAYISAFLVDNFRFQ